MISSIPDLFFLSATNPKKINIGNMTATQILLSINEVRPRSTTEYLVVNVPARATFNNKGQLIAIARISDVSVIGGNAVSSEEATTFDVMVEVTHSNLMVRILDIAIDGLVTQGTFAEHFRCRQTSYPLTIKEHDNFTGFGSGHVVIDIATQKVKSFKITSDSELDDSMYGQIIMQDENEITVACTFANHCANTMRVIA